MMLKLNKVVARCLLLAGFAVTIAMSTESYAAGDTLRVAVEGTYKPFSYTDSNGNLLGFDVDIANALCEQMRVTCKIGAQEWDGIIPGLQADRYDAIIASMARTPEREKKVLFTNPYENQPSSFVAAKDAHISDISPSALKGKTIGVQRGSSQNQWLVANGYDKTAVVKLYDTTRQPELDLAAGRIDLLIGSKVTMSADFFKRPESKDFEFVGAPLTGGALGNGNAIAVRLDNTQLCDRLNAALKAIIANGTYDKIRKRYFDFPML
jgi:lysine-arginine-ornithine-binding protein